MIRSGSVKRHLDLLEGGLEAAESGDCLTRIAMRGMLSVHRGEGMDVGKLKQEARNRVITNMQHVLAACDERTALLSREPFAPEDHIGSAGEWLRMIAGYFDAALLDSAATALREREREGFAHSLAALTVHVGDARMRARTAIENAE